jgi:hypothetical protein
MANINLYDAYNSKARKYGINDSDRFRESFVDAVNLAYGEFNDQVFYAETLSMIGSVDDIIESRLKTFTTLTFDNAADGPDEIIENREYWAFEWDVELTSATNGLTDTITDDASNVVFTILNGVFSVAGSTVAGSATLPDGNRLTIRFESNEDGNELTVDDEAVTMTYTTGDDETSQAIGDVSTAGSHVINGASGLVLRGVRFYASGGKLFDFMMNEDSGATLTDIIGEYTATLSGVPAYVWETVWLEPSSGLSTRYKSPFYMALDYHIQDGGEWSIEPDVDLERKWYGRGIKQARNIYQSIATYVNPLGL